MSYAQSQTQDPTAPAHNTHAASSGTGPATPRFTLSSQNLLRGQKAVAIEHNGATYRLQATKLGKLILTK